MEIREDVEAFRELYVTGIGKGMRRRNLLKYLKEYDDFINKR